MGAVIHKCICHHAGADTGFSKRGVDEKRGGVGGGVSASGPIRKRGGWGGGGGGIRKAEGGGGGGGVLYASGTMRKVGGGGGRLLSEEGEVPYMKGGLRATLKQPPTPLYPPLPWSRPVIDLNIILFINMGTKCEGAEPAIVQSEGSIAPPPPPPPLPTPMHCNKNRMREIMWAMRESVRLGSYA